MTNNKRPRTIQIFLPTGDPSGIRIAEQTTSIIRLIEIPRSELGEFLKMPEAKQVGLYFLISGEGKEGLYIGQSGDVGTRLLQHYKNENKDWERALVLVSLTNNLTQTHVLYLESLSIDKAKACQRYDLSNGNNGQKPHTPIPLKADCDEVHEIGSLLLATLGYPIFEPLVNTKSVGEKAEQIFIFKKSDVDARSIYTNEGMIVLKGSKGLTTTKNKIEERVVRQRKELLEKGIIQEEGNSIIFLKDYLFKSPSGASCFFLLTASNGWKEWKTEQGVTFAKYQEDLLEQSKQQSDAEFE